MNKVRLASGQMDPGHSTGMDTTGMKPTSLNSNALSECEIQQGPLLMEEKCNKKSFRSFVHQEEQKQGVLSKLPCFTSTHLIRHPVWHSFSSSLSFYRSYRSGLPKDRGLLANFGCVITLSQGKALNV